MPNITRRAFLVFGAAAGAVAALPGTASARMGGRTPWSTLLGRSEYAVALRKPFVATGSNGQRYRMKLVAIHNVAHARSSKEHAFNLLFKPQGTVPPDGIYRLTSTHARSSDLFISSVGPHGSARRVQALIVRS